MSYILEALRRAEADRERARGKVPGLHTQPLAGRTADSAAGQRRWLPWIGGGLLLLLAGLGAGRWWATGPHEAAAPVPQPLSAPTAAAAVQQPVSVLRPLPAASDSAFLPPAPPPRAVTVAPAPQRSSVAAPAPAPAPAAEASIPRLSELPESMRRELPKLAIAGSVYSDDPASRFVIVNGEVLREGAQLGAELVLEQIRPHELVLRFKGQRYRQPV